MSSAVETSPESNPFGGVVARLTGVNGVLVVLALVTGPVQARVLGPDGRGELAAIITILVLSPVILDFGLASFVARERARGVAAGQTLGTTIPLALGFSLLGVLLAWPVGELLGQDRAVVERFVRLSLLLTPLFVFGWLVIGAARGAQRFEIIRRWQLIGAAGSGLVILGLAAISELTVESAVIVTIGMNVTALAVSLPVFRGTGPWRFDRRVVLPALGFGGRSWLIAVSSVANHRLDQAVLAAVVTSAELGHYAVAVGLTAIASGFVGAVTTAILPRVAQEGSHAVPRIVRVSVLVLTGSLALLTAISPLAVPLMFGSEFERAVPLVAILALATVFMGVSAVIGSALQGLGRPQDSARPQMAGLIITIVGLALTLEALGAVGAALVSCVAYTVVLGGTVRAALREFDTSVSQLLVPRRADVRWLVAALGRRRSTRQR